MAGSTTTDTDAVEPAPIIRVFGGIGVDGPDGPVSIGGPRQQRLLALLVIRAGSVVDVEWLAENLWRDEDRPEAASPALRTYMSRLRHALPEAAQPWIETETAGYRLNAPPDVLEHEFFGALRAEATAARDRDDPLTAHQRLDEAMALWRGDPFRELEDLDWARAEIERLNLNRLEMIEERFEVALALGRHTQITGELAAFTAENRLRERAARQYALALHRSGRTAEALRVLATHRETLADETGLEPSPAIVELEAALLAGDASLDVEKVGRPLRGYRLLEEIGSGAFAVVWRGVQPSVGREVAIKQIRAELASQPEFIRRFEAEAHLIARIEHPHIIPLIDYWRDPDSAYLVMRWLRGGTLERVLDDGPLTVAQTTTLARQIGGALSAAHSQGVVHRDVKASNILYDERQNAFLGDFGIALEAAKSSGPEAALSPGSPAYASPEQIRQERLGPPADVFSLGVVLFECLAGELPFPKSSSVAELIELQLNTPYPSLAELRSDVPAAMSSAIARATTKDPSDRLGTIDEFLAALNDADADASMQAVRPVVSVVTDLANPYKGLRAFESGDAARFFGRERLVTELTDCLSGNGIRSRCLVIVGPSGSGKSSVARAGLLPALRDGVVAGSADWFVTSMTPAPDPFEALEAALLRIAVNPPPSLIEQLRSGPRGIIRGLRRCLPSDDDQAVVLIDQFEELFTGSTAKDATEFLDAVSVAVDDPSSPLRLVVTLRADYYDRPLGHPTFAPIVKQTTVPITPLAPDELERAIVEPARQVGVEFEPGLVARIAAETSGQPSPLPLLQFTLSELFDHRDGAQLTAAAYDEIGGLGGALAARAESIYADADDGQRDAIRRVFGRMTNPSEETADLRRRITRADLGDDPDAAWVIERFGAARLLSFDRDDATREPTVEVAHEALLREWQRLVEWLKADGDLLRSLDALSAAAEAWDTGGRDPVDLHRGARLETAAGLQVSAAERLRDVDSEFIEASQHAADAEQRSERARLTRLRRLVAVVGVALVIAIVAGALAFAAQRRAGTQADEADLATLISRSAAQTTEDPNLAILLALEAHRRSPGPDTQQAVLNALGASSVATRVQSLGFSEDGPCRGGWPAKSSDGLHEFDVIDGLLSRRDVATGEVTTHGLPPDGLDCVGWTHDEALDRRWATDINVKTQWFGPYNGPWEVKREFDDPTHRWKFAHVPTNRLLFVADTAAGPALTILDDVTGETIGTPLSFGDTFFNAEINDEGTLVAAGFGVRGGPDGDGHTFIIDAITGDELHHVVSPLPASLQVFDDATNELVAGNVDGSIMTIDLATGEIVAEVSATTASELLDIGVQPDGSIMVVSESQIEFVDRRTGPTGPTFDLRRVEGARIRSDGLVTTFTTDNRTNLLDLSVGNALVDKSWSIPAFADVTIVDGKAGVVPPGSHQVEVIDLESGEQQELTLTEPDGTPMSVGFINPERDGLWAEDAAAREMVRFAGGEPVQRFDVPGIPGYGFAIGDRWGTTLYSTDAPATGTLFSLDRDDPGIVFSVAAPNAFTAYPHPDGGLLVIDYDGRLHLYDEAGELVYEHETDLDDVFWVSVDASSGRIAMSPAAGGLTVLDPTTGNQEAFPVPDRLRGISFVRDGEFLVLASGDGTVRLWDVDRGASAGVVWDGAGPGQGTETWYDDATDSVWLTTSTLLVRIPLDPDDWVAQACRIVGRELTDDERSRLVPGDDVGAPSPCD